MNIQIDSLYKTNYGILEAIQNICDEHKIETTTRDDKLNYLKTKLAESYELNKLDKAKPDLKRYLSALLDVYQTKHPSSVYTGVVKYIYNFLDTELRYRTSDSDILTYEANIKSDSIKDDKVKHLIELINKKCDLHKQISELTNGKPYKDEQKFNDYRVQISMIYKRVKSYYINHINFLKTLNDINKYFESSRMTAPIQKIIDAYKMGGWPTQKYTPLFFWTMIVLLLCIVLYIYIGFKHLEHYEPWQRVLHWIYTFGSPICILILAYQKK